ncbi:hypothetical protein M885DRAFT_546602 [Pelagophyceae sp. CCMP2097]|nr:hypothetical protein M885DRAFT_546602 [Pelagophyceae sp. CCMP2097]
MRRPARARPALMTKPWPAPCVGTRRAWPATGGGTPSGRAAFQTRARTCNSQRAHPQRVVRRIGSSVSCLCASASTSAPHSSEHPALFGSELHSGTDHLARQSAPYAASSGAVEMCLSPTPPSAASSLTVVVKSQRL